MSSQEQEDLSVWTSPYGGRVALLSPEQRYNLWHQLYDDRPIPKDIRHRFDQRINYEGDGFGRGSLRNEEGLAKYEAALKQGVSIGVNFSNRLEVHVIYDEKHKRFEAQLRAPEGYAVSKRDLMLASRKLGGDEHGIYCAADIAEINKFLAGIPDIGIEVKLARRGSQSSSWTRQ